MSSERRPCSRAAVAAAAAACWAAKGVPLRDPLKPRVPALDQVITLPSRSVMVTRVLLKEACTWAIPCTTCFFSFLAFLAPTGLVVVVGGARPAGVGAALHQPLDVHGRLLAQVTLHPTLGVDDLGDPADLLLREVLHPHAGFDPRPGEDSPAAGGPDAVDVGQRDLNPLLARKVDSCDACHVLPLPLFVLLVGADDPHHPPTTDHLALDAELLHRRSHLHCRDSPALLTAASRFARVPRRRGRAAPAPRPPGGGGAGSRRPPHGR